MSRLIDLTGKRFGKWTVLKRENGNGNGSTYWSCLCFCGKKKIVDGSSLKTGDSKSCGCERLEDLVGKKFGRWTVLKFKERREKDYYWICECECGKIKKVLSKSLKAGVSKSCGCLATEGKITHGFSKYHIFKAWLSMKQRTTLENNRIYRKYYIDKGITVCDRWLLFENFRDDMYESYLLHVEKYGEKNTTLDRINSNGNYEPSNCRWATYKIQNRNKSSNTIIEFSNQKKCLSEWAEELGVEVGILCNRLYKSHWSIERTLTTPVKSIKKKSSYEINK